MLEQILQLDYWLFKLMNGVWHHPFLDYLLPILRNKHTWIPLYIAIFFLLLYKFPKQILIIIGFAVLCITLSDQIVCSFIKPFFGRLRPCQQLEMEEQIRLLVNCGVGKSFVSAHAANHFALATYLSQTFKYQFSYFTPIAFCWAGSIAYSQVYVGVHYPIDILLGACLGGLIGYLMANILKNLITSIK